MEVAWGVLLQAGLTHPGVEAGAAPIPWQLPPVQSQPGALEGSRAESAALARGRAWKQSGFGMSL